MDGCPGTSRRHPPAAKQKYYTKLLACQTWQQQGVQKAQKQQRQGTERSCDERAASNAAAADFYYSGKLCLLKGLNIPQPGQQAGTQAHQYSAGMWYKKIGCWQRHSTTT
jgi:hypothetical protein